MRNKKTRKALQNTTVNFSGDKAKRSFFAYIIPIVLISFFCYAPALKNKFTNWDDPIYVTENNLIKNLSIDSIKKIFHPQTHVVSNYHPLTILSLAVNYHFSKLNPRAYILTNILFHLANIVLVFYFVYLLFERKIWLASIVALLFGIHPMHVESVAWISERKDVLYSFFFISSLIFYLKYLEQKKLVFILGSFILFTLSCLSKAMAVVFPIVLLVIDYYKSRKFTYKLVLEKIPFLILALIIGLLAFSIQSKGAINAFGTFSLLQRLMFASYGFVMYIVKLFVPVNLSAFYPYPIFDKVPLPTIFYITPFIMFSILLLPVLIAILRKSYKLLIFSLLFYFLNIVLVIQFISVGAAVMADRYSYISSLGIFFLVAHGLNNIKTKKRIIILFSIWLIILCSLCFQRVKVWKNSEILWTDAIKKFPTSAVLYKYRASHFVEKKDWNNALSDYTMAASLPNKDSEIYNMLGNIYSGFSQWNKALEFHNKAIELNKKSFQLYLNRAVTYSKMKEYKKAIEDYTTAVQLNPSSETAYKNRAQAYMEIREYEKAIADYNKVIEQNPKESLYFFNRGSSYFYLKKYGESMKDFKQASLLNPNYDMAFYNISIVHYELNQFKEALLMALKAQELGYPVDTGYIKQLRAGRKEE